METAVFICGKYMFFCKKNYVIIKVVYLRKIIATGDMKMGKLIYVTGGARSGKSFLAESIVREYDQYEKVYLATSVPFDLEMQNRVKKHQDQRGPNWLTIESYRDLDSVLENKLGTSGKYVILLDCLTYMVNNLMFDHKDIDWDNVTQERVDIIEDNIKNEVEKLINYLSKTENILVVVSNEVGMGLVPEYPLGRYYRDIAGRMNQYMGKEASEAYLVVSGIKIKIK